MAILVTYHYPLSLVIMKRWPIFMSNHRTFDWTYNEKEICLLNDMEVTGQEVRNFVRYRNSTCFILN